MAPDAEQSRPFVVTLEIDDQAQARFDGERAALFAPGRTQVAAHVTLFHAVPAAQEPAVLQALAAAAAREPFPVEVFELMPLGRGVAYRLRSAELLALHRELQDRWWEALTRQDRQGFRPHVTVQNKVSPEVASRTLAQLRQDFAPFAITARGLRLWRYDGGPWTYRERFAFGAASRSEPRNLR
ncbi:MAG TPA: 2'-5' RNA ligase family protein [Jatrophihabitans sp.]|uniref:2'-5' RNA ligase family protein n=1 Tax=Jatrophihabitans sp. TaxID=1932789 RepID=UPI002F13DE0C